MRKELMMDMNVLKGKKLLILGASPSEISLVKRAKELGIYTIVTDSNLDKTLSPAKNIADEYWDISWSDISTLVKKCNDVRIDGVISGYSEFRVENTIKLTKELGLPCYCTEEQLDITRDKIKFKNACRESNVPVIREYSSVEEVANYPVIVKPVDRAGSIGISVATNRDELLKAYTYAMDMSVCKRVIIEDFIYKAIKFDAYYMIIDGDIQLVSTDDVLLSEKNGYERVVQNGWVLPSKHQLAFIEKEDENLKRMIKNMKIQNGYIFFSGFADTNDNFVFFECGFRLCGGHLYNYFPKIGACNTLDLFISHALTGKCLCKNPAIDLNPKLKCVTLNYYATKGVISKIEGFDEVSKIDDCCHSLVQCHIGQVCNNDKAILSKVGFVYFCAEDKEKLEKDVELANKLIHVFDSDGNDIIYDKVSKDLIFK